MLASITPLGERGRGSRWWLTTVAYTVGSVAGGAVLGLAAGAVGSLVRRLTGGVTQGPRAAAVALGIAGLLVIVAALSDAGVLPSLRGPHRQVDERWLVAYRGWVYGVGFGAQLGVGVVTIVTTAALWAAVLLAALTGSWAGGLAVGVAFGLARAVPVLATVRVRDTAALARLHARLAAYEPLSRRLTVGALATAAVVALAGSALLAGRHGVRL